MSAILDINWDEILGGAISGAIGAGGGFSFSTIWGFLVGIYDVLCNIFDALMRIIGDLPYVISLVGSFLLNIPGYFAWLPSPVVSVIVTCFGIVATYLIIGRG